MKLRTFRTFLAISVTVLFVTYFTLYKLSEKPRYVFHVRIPLLSKQGESQEEFYWRSKKALFPKIEIPTPISPYLPNDDTFLVISLSQNGSLEINSSDFGSIEDTNPLSTKLNEVFLERQKFGDYEPNSDKIVKAVVIKAPRSAKYNHVVKLIDAVKSSGADPVVLQIDELPE